MLDNQKHAFSLSVRKAFVIRGRSEQTVGAILLGTWWEQLRPYGLADVVKALAAVAINESLHLSVGNVLQKLKIIKDDRQINQSIEKSHQQRNSLLLTTRRASHNLPASVADMPFPHAGEVPCFPLERYKEAEVIASGDRFLDLIRAMKMRGEGGQQIADRVMGLMAQGSAQKAQGN